MGEIPGSKSSIDHEVERALNCKTEPKILDFVLPSEGMWSRGVGENIASSSGSNLRSSLIGMGFLSSLVDKAIEEKGEDDADLLVETLFAYSDHHKSHAESSDSLDDLFDNKGANSPPEVFTVESKEEPDVFDDINEDKRPSQRCCLRGDFSSKAEDSKEVVGEYKPDWGIDSICRRREANDWQAPESG